MRVIYGLGLIGTIIAVMINASGCSNHSSASEIMNSPQIKATLASIDAHSDSLQSEITKHLNEKHPIATSSISSTSSSDSALIAFAKQYNKNEKPEETRHYGRGPTIAPGGYGFTQSGLLNTTTRKPKATAHFTPVVNHTPHAENNEPINISIEGNTKMPIVVIRGGINNTVNIIVKGSPSPEYYPGDTSIPHVEL